MTGVCTPLVVISLITVATRPTESDALLTYTRSTTGQGDGRGPAASPPPGSSMAALRLCFVVVCCYALFAGSSFIRRQDVFSLEPISWSSAPSRIACGALCQTRRRCHGFTLTADGVCQMFDSLWVGEEARGGMLVDYLLPMGAPCPPGWHLFRKTCLLWASSSTGLDWSDSRKACQSRGAESDLVVLNRELVTWLLYHTKRSRLTSYVGLKIDGGKFIQLGGSASRVKLTMLPDHADPGCVLLRRNLKTDTAWNSQPCMNTSRGYVCQSPRHCQFDGTCVGPGWKPIGDYCYFSVANAMTRSDADRECALMPALGARVASVSSINLWHMLYENFGEGNWSIHTGSSSVDSKQLEDATSGGGCTAMGASGEDQVSCSKVLPFVCQTPVSLC